MGILETWSLINFILKMTNKVDYTYWQVLKPMWLGYPIIIAVLIVIFVAACKMDDMKMKNKHGRKK